MGFGNDFDFGPGDYRIQQVDAMALLRCLEQNMCKTFIMPVYREVNALIKMARQQTKLNSTGGSSSEAQQKKAESALGGIGSLLMTGVQNVSTMASKVQNEKDQDPPPPSEAIRKITDHFISFIQKIDTFFEEEIQRQRSSRETDPIIKQDEHGQE